MDHYQDTLNHLVQFAHSPVLGNNIGDCSVIIKVGNHFEDFFERDDPVVIRVFFDEVHKGGSEMLVLP